MLGQGRTHALFGGTKILQITPSPSSSPSASSSSRALGPVSQEGCLAVVVRTGFRTSQGKLVRTMFYSSERISANSVESLLFILFLLIFALVAAAYVWHHST